VLARHIAAPTWHGRYPLLSIVKRTRNQVRVAYLQRLAKHCVRRSLPSSAASSSFTKNSLPTQPPMDPECRVAVIYDSCNLTCLLRFDTRWASGWQALVRATNRRNRGWFHQGSAFQDGQRVMENGAAAIIPHPRRRRATRTSISRAQEPWAG